MPKITLPYSEFKSMNEEIFKLKQIVSELSDPIIADYELENLKKNGSTLIIANLPRKLKATLSELIKQNLDKDLEDLDIESVNIKDFRFSLEVKSKDASCKSCPKDKITGLSPCEEDGECPTSNFSSDSDDDSDEYPF